LTEAGFLDQSSFIRKFMSTKYDNQAFNEGLFVHQSIITFYCIICFKTAELWS